MIISTLVDITLCLMLRKQYLTYKHLEWQAQAKKKGRQLQQGSHKGPIRIDTPPPQGLSIDQSSFRRRLPRKNGSETNNVGNVKMSVKSKTHYPRGGKNRSGFFQASEKSRVSRKPHSRVS